MKSKSSESIVDKKPVSRSSKVLRVTGWSVFGVACTAFLLGTFAYAGVFDSIYDKYDPSVTTLVDVAEPTNEWQTVEKLGYSRDYDFENMEKGEDRDYLEYNSILAKKTVSCYPGADLQGKEDVKIDIRVIDKEDNTVVGQYSLDPVEPCNIDVSLNKQYSIQYKTETPGHYTLQFE